MHIARTGGTTIALALGLKRHINSRRMRENFTQSGKIYIGHQKYADLRKRGLVGDDFHVSAFKFAFCRNPYSRAVDQWLHNRQRKTIPADLSFDGFCNNLKKYWKICHPQSVYIRGVLPDFIGRFERFEKDLRKVAKLIEVEIDKIPHCNKIPQKDFRSYYTEKTEKQVTEFYNEDFELFAYKKQIG